MLTRFFWFTVWLLVIGVAQGRELEERTNHVFGFIPKQAVETSTSNFLDIIDANRIPSDQRLAKPEPGEAHQLKITLDRLEISDYPGWGILNLLFVFSAQDQASIYGQSLDKAQAEALQKGLEIEDPNAAQKFEKVYKQQQLWSGTQTTSQPVKYTHLYQIREGDGLGVNGYPVFVGLRSGEEGPAFRISIIKLKSDDDLDLAKKITDKTSKGLRLAGPYGELASVVTGQVEGMVEHIKERTENKLVQDVFLGLDHSDVSTRAKLAEGSYIIAQIDHDPTNWDWSQWKYDVRNGQIVRKGTEPYQGNLKDASREQLIARKMDYNYLVVGVSKMAAPRNTKPK